MHRLGEIRDRKPENQSYRASVLTLLTAAISLWNTVYMERAIDALKRKGLKINEQLLSHLSPLAWEHINLTGDYIWKKATGYVSIPALIPCTFEISGVSAISRYSAGVRLFRDS